MIEDTNTTGTQADAPKKRVLLTGAGGFMGSHVLRHLLINTNWDIVVLDSFKHRGNTARLNVQMEGIADALQRVSVITHDLKAPISAQLNSKLGHIDYVLSVASESHVDRSITDPRDFIENNVALMLTLLEWAREYPVEKFVHISTDEVYGPAYGDYKHQEGEAHRPSNPYSASKAAQENICFSYWRTYDMPIVITNTMNIIGELQDTEKYIPMVIKRVYEGSTVTIHASASGIIGSRFYLHARNQADALLYVLRNVEPELYSDGFMQPAQFNIVSEREVNNLELAELVAKFVGKPLHYELVDFHSSRPGHDLRYALDGTRLQQHGWVPPYKFEDSLKRTVEWTLAHPEWIA